MQKLRQLLANYRTANWLLIVALFLGGSIPGYYHLHSEHDSASQHYSMDMHLEGDAGDVAHHQEDQTLSFASAPDGVFKTNVFKLLNLVLWLTVISIIVIPVLRVLEFRSVFRQRVYRQLFQHITPPSRAPPRN